MRALFIADATFALREQEMLARLWLALADEGWRVVQAVPRSVLPRFVHSEGWMGGFAGIRDTGGGSLGGGLFARVLPYNDLPVPFLGFLPFTGLRASALLNLIEDQEDFFGASGSAQGAETLPADIVHATGGTSWVIALEIARRLDVPVVLEIWRHGQVERARRIAASLRARSSPSHSKLCFLAPDPAIESALIAADTGLPVRLVPWGVHPNAHSPSRPVNPHRSVMVIGSGNDSNAFAAALTGLASAIARLESTSADPPPPKTEPVAETLVFIDSDAARRARIWPLLNRLGLIPRTSLIENLEARRDLLIQGDVLVLPEARGEHRTALLDAMAAGMLVAAAADPMVSILRDGETAALVERADPGLWANTIESLLSPGSSPAPLARTARQHIERDASAVGHARALLDLYDTLTGARWAAVTNHSTRAQPTR